MRKVELEGDLESILRQLYDYKMKGDHVYCEYKGVNLDSDTITREIAGSVYPWKPNDEVNKLSTEEQDAYYKSLVEYDRKIKGVNDATPELILAGIKAICEYKYESHNDLLMKLLHVGCNFNYDEIKYFYHPKVEENIFEAIARGDFGVAAKLIINVRDSTLGRNYIDERFLSYDSKDSFYAFVRRVTGDKTYTKENLERKSGRSL